MTKQDTNRIKADRIQRIRDNMAENDRLLADSKRTKATHLLCRKDGLRAIAEIRSAKTLPAN